MTLVRPLERAERVVVIKNSAERSLWRAGVALQAAPMTYIHTKPTELLLRLTYTIRECLTLEAAGNASLFPGYRRPCRYLVSVSLFYLCMFIGVFYVMTYKYLYLFTVLWKRKRGNTGSATCYVCFKFQLNCKNYSYQTLT